MNVGLYNGEDLFDLTKLLINKFGHYRKFALYTAPLFLGIGNPPLILSNEESNKVIDDCIKIESYIKDNGLNIDYGVFADKFRTKHCMADQHRAPVITIDGNLTPCEHYFEDHVCGNIYDGITDYDVLENWTEYNIDMEACETCFNYPKCANLKNCPNEIFCEDPQRKLHLYKLTNAIMKSYNIYCSKKKK